MSEAGHSDPTDPNGDLQPIYKRMLKGADPITPRSDLLVVEQGRFEAFASVNAIAPTLRPDLLVRWWELSSILRPLTDVMLCNTVDGGWRLDATIDPYADDSLKEIETSLILQREQEAADEGKGPPPPPTAQEVLKRKAQLEEESWRQRVRAQAFLKSCGGIRDFIDVLRDALLDRLVVGWGLVEVRRNALGLPKRISTEKAFNFRVLPFNGDVEADIFQWETRISYRKERDFVRFRRFVQWDQYLCQLRYFKEFGDPRTVSSVTGREYDSVSELMTKEPKSRPANELIWLTQPNPEIGTYGLPPWAGQVNSVVGSYKGEIVNVIFFDDNTIPPVIIAISGGSLAETVKQQIINQIIENKGTGSFNKPIFVEAEGPSSGGATLLNQAQAHQVRIDVIPLTEALFKDELFGKYDQSNRRKIRESFRIPAILIGDTQADTRATVEAALRYADVQVFAPERAYVERVLNRTLMMSLGVNLWEIKFRPLFQVDPQQLMESVFKLTQHVITPDEGRLLLNQYLDYPLDRIDEKDAPWVEMPLKQFLGELAMKASGQGTTSEREVKVSQELIEALISAQ